MKVLIGVISSRMYPWARMIQTSKRTWDSVDVPGVETIYYVGAPVSPLEDRVIGFDIADNLHTMGRKNLAFFRWALAREWDFLARTNASCFTDKARLLKYCNSLPRTRLVVGGMVERASPAWMWGGYQFLLSRDVVEAIVANADQWDHLQMDDVALSRMVFGLGYEHTPMDRACSLNATRREGEHDWLLYGSDGNHCSFSDFRAAALARSDKIFFRVKQDGARHLDAVIMHELHDHYIRRQASPV